MTHKFDTETTPPPGVEPTRSMIAEVLERLSNLVRKEINLARAELNENFNRAAVAVGLIVGALVIALTALDVLAAALVAAIAELGIEAGWAALIVGVALALVAWGMARKGMNDLKLSSLAPTRTSENVQRDAKAIKENLK